MSTATLIQLGVFLFLNALVGVITWWHCRHADRKGHDTKEYFLAGSSLNWVFIASSLTLTNINTDTLVGWNGNQMLLVACGELAGVPSRSTASCSAKSPGSNSAPARPGATSTRCSRREPWVGRSLR